MIIIMEKGATDENIQKVCTRLEENGFQIRNTRQMYPAGIRRNVSSWLVLQSFASSLTSELIKELSSDINTIRM